ncbi:MAG: hypothetical protein KF850_41370 [Labilithrix sp.]|nr:hypothetical protein [Labilithrix sp.]
MLRVGRRRARGGASLLLSLAACTGDSHGPTVDESLTQYSGSWRFDDLPAIDFLFVVDASASAESAAVRAEAARAISETASALQESGGRWRPVDVRAYVAKIGDHALRSPDDDVRLAWVERDASQAGADLFAEAVIDAMSTPSASPDATNTLATLRLALGAVPVRPDAVRAVVLVTARDDPSAGDLAEATWFDDRDRLVRAILPRAEDGRCLPPRWALSEWLRANVESPCGASLSPAGHGSGLSSVCVRRAMKTLPDGTAECALRARMASPPARERGLGPCERDASATLDSAGGLACTVTPLTGRDAERCRDPSDACEGCASGWCVQGSARGCEGGSVFRFVGGAAPGGAAIDVVCNVAR